MDKKLAVGITIFMSAFWSIFSAVYIATVTFVEVPMGNERVVDQVLGFIMGTVVATVINFWLGSSWGSKAKDSENKKGVLNDAVSNETSTDSQAG